MSVLAELQDGISNVVAQAGPALVGIGQRWGVGSGVVIQTGTVLTNAHNVRGEQVAVTFSDGRTATGSVAAIDIDGDLAIVNVDTQQAPPIRWSERPEVGIGSAVFALSNPGGRGLRVTVGLVSGTERSFRGPRGRKISGSIEHTAPLLPGSSGGPITDLEGRLLGINTNRLGEGFYLAIPADATLRERVDALTRGEAPRRHRLGVAIAPPHVARRLRDAVGLEERDGLLVRGVEEGSPAAGAGIREGDLITKTDGTAITDVDQLHAILDAVPSGGSLTLTLLRGAEERDVTVSFASGG